MSAKEQEESAKEYREEQSSRRPQLGVGEELSGEEDALQVLLNLEERMSMGEEESTAGSMPKEQAGAGEQQPQEQTGKQDTDWPGTQSDEEDLLELTAPADCSLLREQVKAPKQEPQRQAGVSKDDWPGTISDEEVLWEQISVLEDQDNILIDRESKDFSSVTPDIQGVLADVVEVPEIGAPPTTTVGLGGQLSLQGTVTTWPTVKSISMENDDNISFVY